MDLFTIYIYSKDFYKLIKSYPQYPQAKLSTGAILESYPQIFGVIHRLSTGYPQVIHRVIHRLSVIVSGVFASYPQETGSYNNNNNIIYMLINIINREKRLDKVKNI
jgi:hypothetical protein